MLCFKLPDTSSQPLPGHQQANACTHDNQDLREARGKAEGYIIGLVDAGHLCHDGERDYTILGSFHLRQDFLRTLLSTYT
ncbi:hypothetical protein L483_17155 [Pseudomonas putida H8234]|nr:hypothetical protein L483_17155 [Pseudomonas putida H8234]